MGKASGIITLDLDKERKFQLNLNAMLAFEEETGKSLLDMNDGNFSISDVRALLWAGLNEFEDITLEEAGKMLHTGNLEQFTKEIMGAYQGAMPDVEPGTKGETKGKNKNRSAG